LLIATVFYLRPGELLGSSVGSVNAPLPGAGPGHLRWSLFLHEFVTEESRPSKTREFDETLSLDLDRYQFLGAALRKLTADRHRDAPLLNLPPAGLAEVMAR